MIVVFALIVLAMAASMFALYAIGAGIRLPWLCRIVGHAYVGHHHPRLGFYRRCESCGAIAFPSRREVRS